MFDESYKCLTSHTNVFKGYAHCRCAKFLITAHLNILYIPGYHNNSIKFLITAHLNILYIPGYHNNSIKFLITAHLNN